MVDSVRETIINAILTCTGGQYGLVAPEDERDLPITIVQDGFDTITASYDMQQGAMPITVARAEAAISSNRDTMRVQANAALAAIVLAMHADETFGGLAIGLDYTGGGISAEVGKFVFAEATFVVRYEHARGYPFNFTI